ncbi:uncharacterized protein ARMOST_21151 [Armillaria ostoyae]|uniref:Uncharacterized protein n=1 Tax=Armillaria ostoyae TaxID=47428 RepID=A0A284S9B2_ARMOS|nr:uncharacterized protein ARMOST_21151 [Armillaria ostoyae]
MESHDLCKSNVQKNSGNLPSHCRQQQLLRRPKTRRVVSLSNGESFLASIDPSRFLPFASPFPKVDASQQAVSRFPRTTIRDGEECSWLVTLPDLWGTCRCALYVVLVYEKVDRHGTGIVLKRDEEDACKDIQLHRLRMLDGRHLVPRHTPFPVLAFTVPRLATDGACIS